MQHIGVQIQDELETSVERLDFNFANILNYLYQDYEKNLKTYPWITTVDPYGDTIFNSFQLKCFISDLNRLKDDSKEQYLVETIEKFLGVLPDERIEKERLHIKFLGD